MVRLLVDTIFLIIEDEVEPVFQEGGPSLLESFELLGGLFGPLENGVLSLLPRK